jgi:glycosyltransferase involved in cell wall biosynthesis
LEVYPSKEGLGGHVKGLLQDPERLSRLAARGPAIVDHLHRPGTRATQIFQGIWPHHRVLSGKGFEPRISILVTCHRYLRRLRVCLESLARQDLPPGSLEIVVADPASPDGLAAHLEEFSRKYAGLRVVHLPIDERYHRNRGVGINRAFDASAGRVIVGIDGDLVFPSGLIGVLEGCVLNAPGRVYGVRRVFLAKAETEKILVGEIDPVADFERLSGSEGDGEEKAFVGVLGYCQAVDRKAFARARYPEELDMVNQSDIVFVDRLASEAQVTPQYLNDRAVLHLWHPRNWAGTSEFL